MGFYQRWIRPLRVDQKTFKKIVADFEKLVVPLAEHGVKLADDDGDGAPIINQDEIAFNGVRRCGCKRNRRAVQDMLDMEALEAQDVDGYDLDWKEWRCNGCCSFDPFTFPRFEARCEEFADEEGRVCRSVKTNRRRYDLAVTCLLLIAKHYLGDQLTVLSANREAWWDETREICQRVLGYGEGMYVGEPWSCSVDTSDPRSPAAHAAWLLKQKDKLAMVPES